ncbi:hypothetical protein BHE74_00010416 [Ensete ventricosum]|nr:hypothetical protein GW17_00038224 [Ensete ventricosum]RWW81213.1 hypothetical protein BHE74_00010416 [Ensete ventricosum]RZR80330.1 hypothetical protein BHM03_00006344 [Ensete ventricosum]
MMKKETVGAVQLCLEPKDDEAHEEDGVRSRKRDMDILVDRATELVVESPLFGLHNRTGSVSLEMVGGRE